MAIESPLSRYPLPLPDSGSTLFSSQYLLEQIAVIIGASPTDQSVVIDPNGDFVGHIFNVNRLFEDLDVPSLVSCVLVRSPRLGDVELDGLRHFIESLKRSSNTMGAITIVIPLGVQMSSIETQRLIDDRLRHIYAIDTLVLQYNDLVRITLSQDRIGESRKKLLSKVDLSALSTSVFVITGPVRDSSFFGREREMRTMVEHAADTTFAVIGGRRIGKTSLLRRLHRVQLPAAGYATVYHDCSPTTDLASFRNAALDSWHPVLSDARSLTFAEIVADRVREQRLVLLLDEADELVATDQADGWPLFKELRALTNSGRLQVVFSGERILRNAMRDPSGPMYNLADEVLLGPLDYHAVHELVTRPMKQLGVDLADETAIVDSIWSLTSGHPNVVQRLCRRLIVRLSQQNSRCITIGDIQHVTEDPAFQRDDFLATYWERATPLEKILSLLLVDEIRPCSLPLIRTALQGRYDLNPKAQEVDAALQRLVDLRSLLKYTPMGYDFAVPAFPSVVKNKVTLTDMLEILIEEYQERGE